VFQGLKAKRASGSQQAHEISSGSRLNGDLDTVLQPVKEVEEEKY